MRLFHTFDLITELDVSNVLISKRRKNENQLQGKAERPRKAWASSCLWFGASSYRRSGGWSSTPPFSMLSSE